MIKISFRDEEIALLQELQEKSPQYVIRRRALILLLKSQKIPHYQIAKIADVSENTVRHCFEAYLAGGIEEIKTLHFHKPKSRLKPFESEIREYFEKTPPATIGQACFEIGKFTGIELKESQMGEFIKSLGLKRRKVNGIPARADIGKQKEFHDNQLQPRLQEAVQGKRGVYFVDASHFVLGAFLGYLWCFVRVFVRTPSGRQRFNVLGALDAVTKELITVSNDAYITSHQVCELLKKIRQKTVGAITLVLDNARYQRCHLVMDFAQELEIELLFLPPYSPNLNLIERLWKLVKKECLNSRYHDI